MTEFKIDFLDDYSDEALIAELKRVGAMVAPDPLTSTLFNQYAKVSASTVRRRFGGWGPALKAAGLAHLYSGRTVNAVMREQIARKLSDAELLEILKQVALELKTQVLTSEGFQGRSNVSVAVYRARFGSWKRALELAGLQLSSLGKRYSQEDYFTNLAKVWTGLGRRPNYSEMRMPPSEITPDGYAARFGSWRKALAAFVEWTNQEVSDTNLEHRACSIAEAEVLPLMLIKPEDRREVPDRLRWRVFERDNFTCVVCGRSRAKGDDIKLHADHILPWSKGGKTVIENLQSLCETCNLGKGNSHPAQTN